MSLSEAVTTKLIELVEEISGEILDGKPALLASCLYFNLEREIINQIKDIESTFE